VVKRIPQLVADLEILFVEGHSQDGTLDEIRRVISTYPQKNIKVLVQDGIGKGDAVRKGMAALRHRGHTSSAFVWCSYFSIIGCYFGRRNHHKTKPLGPGDPAGMR
jgi:hypothetical protein